MTNIKKKNICIIGLMGSGKSIIGKDLSKYLNMKFYDSDKEIEIKTRQNVNSIFEEKGELFFRNIEEKICLELLTQDNCIISLGGGSIINKKIRKAIKQNSYSIYLQVKLNNLLARLQNTKKRPLLNKNLDKKQILKNLYLQRQKFYEKADFVIDNNKDKSLVLEKIKTQLKSYEN